MAVVPRDGVQAAILRKWGPVVAGDEFNYVGAPNPAKWKAYDSVGHAGKGIRSPKALKVASGAAFITGDAHGTTGGMSAKFAQQKYGRWETRMRTTVRDLEYHPVALLWPNNNSSPNCAEVDYAEALANPNVIKFSLHYACTKSNYQSRRPRPSTLPSGTTTPSSGPGPESPATSTGSRGTPIRTPPTCRPWECIRRSSSTGSRTEPSPGKRS